MWNGHHHHPPHHATQQDGSDGREDAARSGYAGDLYGLSGAAYGASRMEPRDSLAMQPQQRENMLAIQHHQQALQQLQQQIQHAQDGGDVEFTRQLQARSDAEALTLERLERERQHYWEMQQPPPELSGRMVAPAEKQPREDPLEMDGREYSAVDRPQQLHSPEFREQHVVSSHEEVVVAESNRELDADAEETLVEVHHHMPAEKRPRGTALQRRIADEEAEPVRATEQEAAHETNAESPFSSKSEGVLSSAIPVARGKPEAMAAGLASIGIEEKRKQLQAEREQEAAEVVAEVAEDATTGDAVSPATVVSEAPAPKPKKRKSPSTKKNSSSANIAHPSIHDPVPPMTDAEYENVEALMTQFCKVPLLAEFSRPVTLLHPELIPVYSKIVTRPIDLGRVCRGIRRRQYKNARAVRLDMWRIFANCVKYHSHPHNKDAVPSFVSIALHLRDFFNNLWQEYMLPSDPPPPLPDGTKPGSPLALQKEAFAAREKGRKQRLCVSALTVMSAKCIEKTIAALDKFLTRGGRVDGLDVEPIFDNDDLDDDDGDMDVVVDNLRKLQRNLPELSTDMREYGIDEFEGDIKSCYTEDLFDNNPALKLRVRHRLDRFVGKIVVPIHEANCRGVTQSSIWGCMAAAVWARESSKKAYWPALVLGIMAPEDQKEEWHVALTARNEARLPEKLRAQLHSGKRKAEQALRKQSMGQAEPQSFFLVEFLGTHEFIWVKESDIVENFDPNEDPNQQAPPSSKKKRSSRHSTANVTSSKTYVTAIEEARWALEEFEVQLQDTCGDMVEEDEESESIELNYSYGVLCQSDDEADEEVGRSVDDNAFPASTSDVDEANELLATEGLLDFSTAGRKNAKKRTQAMKKQKADADRKVKAEQAKKAKAELSKKRKESRAKDLDEKRMKKELEKKRKKRGQEREKALKGTNKDLKRKRVSSMDSEDGSRSKISTGRRASIVNKKGRASAIVNGYLTRMATNNDYKSLALNGVMTMPASLVDSSGLLGMALAFRSAAGELAMPDDSHDRETKADPWDLIDVDGPASSTEREQKLENQISLLEKEIGRVKSSTEIRRSLQEESLKRRKDLDDQVLSKDKVSRQNYLKKRKKATKPDRASSKGGKEAKDELSDVKDIHADEAKADQNLTDVVDAGVVGEQELGRTLNSDDSVSEAVEADTRTEEMKVELELQEADTEPDAVQD